MPSWLRSTITLLSLVCIWEVYSQMVSEAHFVLPAPTNILIRLSEQYERFLYNSKVTLEEIIGGCVIAFLIAFPLAWIMYLFQTARQVLQPLFVVIQCVPMFTLAPIMVIWFDWSYTAIVIPTALMIFFPLTMNIFQGLRSVPPQLIDFFQINQASTWQIFYKLQLPWALPHICSGIRISAAMAGIGAVAGEWAGAQAGLGVMMLESRRAIDLETTFAALFCLTVISLIFYSLTYCLEFFVYHQRTAKEKSNNGVLSRILSLILIVPLVSCSPQDEDEEDGKTVRLVLDWLPNPNHIPLYVGIKKGYFEDEGISLNVKKVHDPGDVLPYLTSRQTELALSYAPHTVRAIARQAPITPIASLIDQPLNCIIYRSDIGIQTPSDLNGKVIGYCIDGNTPSFLNQILISKQITPKIKRNVSFDLVSTLGTGKVDAIYGAYWNIEIEQLRTFGIEAKFFPLTDFGVPSYPEIVVVTNTDSTFAKQPFISSFQRALTKSIQECRENPDEAFAIYLSYNPDKAAGTQTWERRSWERTLSLLPRFPAIDTKMLSALRNWHMEHGLLSE